MENGKCAQENVGSKIGDTNERQNFYSLGREDNTTQWNEWGRSVM